MPYRVLLTTTVHIYASEKTSTCVGHIYAMNIPLLLLSAPCITTPKQLASCSNDPLFRERCATVWRRRPDQLAVK